MDAVEFPTNDHDGTHSTADEGFAVSFSDDYRRINKAAPDNFSLRRLVMLLLFGSRYLRATKRRDRT